MDFLGVNAYNKPGVPGEDPEPVGKGSLHYEWRPARQWIAKVAVIIKKLEK